LVQKSGRSRELRSRESEGGEDERPTNRSVLISVSQQKGSPHVAVAKLWQSHRGRSGLIRVRLPLIPLAKSVQLFSSPCPRLQICQNAYARTRNSCITPHPSTSVLLRVLWLPTRIRNPARLPCPSRFAPIDVFPCNAPSPTTLVSSKVEVRCGTSRVMVGVCQETCPCAWVKPVR